MMLKNGILLTWGGFQSLKQLGRMVEVHMLEQTIPKIINLPSPNLKIVDVVCGFQHCLAKTLDCRIISFGDNEFGQVLIYLII